jgi:hypothetical protein
MIRHAFVMTASGSAINLSVVGPAARLITGSSWRTFV